MPGAVFLHEYPPPVNQPTATVAAGDPAGGQGGSHTNFILWLVIVGIVIPVLIMGGLKLGGFQFVYKSR